MPTCNHCGDQAAFVCNYCDNHHCADHRLPENHDCPYQFVAEVDGKRRGHREQTRFVRGGPVGHERKRPVRRATPQSTQDVPEFDAVCIECKRAIDGGEYCKFCEPDDNRPESEPSPAPDPAVRQSSKAAADAQHDSSTGGVLPRCVECGDVHLGRSDQCPDCREASANETATDGGLESRSTIVADGGLPGARWRRTHVAFYKLWAWREVLAVLMIVVALEVFGYVDLIGTAGNVLP